MAQMAKVIIQFKSEGLSLLFSEQKLHFEKFVEDCTVIIESAEQKYFGILDDLNSWQEIRDAYLAA